MWTILDARSPLNAKFKCLDPPHSPLPSSVPNPPHTFIYILPVLLAEYTQNMPSSSSPQYYSSMLKRLG